MGLYAPAFVSELKARGILWFANATTVAEAKAAEDAGADAMLRKAWKPGDTAEPFTRTKRNGKWWV
jgi:nitronate monooxygenase